MIKCVNSAENDIYCTLLLAGFMRELASGMSVLYTPKLVENMILYYYYFYWFSYYKYKFVRFHVDQNSIIWPVDMNATNQPIHGPSHIDLLGIDCGLVIGKGLSNNADGRLMISFMKDLSSKIIADFMLQVIFEEDDNQWYKYEHEF